MKPFQLINCLAITVLLLLGCAESASPRTESAAKQPVAKQAVASKAITEQPAEAGSLEISNDDFAHTTESQSEPKPDTQPDNPSESESNIVYGDQFPEVLAVDMKQRQENQWLFNVTLSSPYDSPQRYADAWRVIDGQDKELGIRILGHDHASEQPFTRSHTIELPDGVGPIFVEGRDQVNGWSGQRFEVTIP